MSATDDSGRRLYKARGPDGEVAWVDHNELWRLQHGRSEELRRRRSRRRRIAAAAGAVLLALAVALIAYRLWPAAGVAVPAPAGSSPAPPVVAPPRAAVPDPAAPTGRPAAAAARSLAEPGGDRLSAPEATAERPPPPAPEERIAAFVQTWAAAWARRDVPAYLACYATGFQPADGSPRPDWERLRRRRLLEPLSIQIELEDLEIALGTAGRPEVRFVQTYDSPAYSDVVRKVLVLVEEEGRWRIAAERAEPA